MSGLLAQPDASLPGGASAFAPMSQEAQIQSLMRQVETLTTMLAQALGQQKLPEVSLSRAVAEMLKAKREANRRPAYLKSLRGYMERFTRGRETQPVAAITSNEIESWVNRCANNWSRQTELNRLNTLFSFCLRHGYVRENPCRRLETRSADYRPPTIFTVEQSRELLCWVAKHKRRCVPWLALGLFAGIRPDELSRITWDCVDLDRATVTIDGAASKVRRRRIVHLQPMVVAWLREFRGGDVSLCHSTKRRMQRQAARALGLTHWPTDALRHSCASYLLAMSGDAGKVAAELGNSVGVLLRHYRELVHREDAERFWALTPAACLR